MRLGKIEYLSKQQLPTLPNWMSISIILPTKTLLFVKVTNDLRVAKSSGQYKPVSVPETDPKSTLLISVNGESVLVA